MDFTPHSPNSSSDYSTAVKLSAPKGLMKQFASDYYKDKKIFLHRATLPPTPSSLPVLEGEALAAQERGMGDSQGEQIHAEIRCSTTQLWETQAEYFTQSMSGGTVIAKFFDPLYYVHNTPYLDDIQVTNGGVIDEWEMIPQFFGLFLASLPPADPSHKLPSRNIYVILIEKVPGTSLDKLNVWDPECVPPDIRDRIMNEAFEIEAKALAFGLLHLEVAPSNVILRVPVKNDDRPKLVMIDFDRSHLVEPGTWDPSPTAQASRIAELRAKPDLAEYYDPWLEAGWLV